MTTPTLPFEIEQTNYSLTDGNQVASTQLDGGAGRYRRDMVGASSGVTAQLTLDVDEYATWRDFFNNDIVFGSLPFLATIVWENGEGSQNLCYIVPGSVKLVSQVGITYVVQFNLEVTTISPTGIFFGMVPTMTPDASVIQALSTKQASSFVGVYSLVGDGTTPLHMCLAFPASFGIPSNFVVNTFNYDLDKINVTINGVIYNVFLNSFPTTTTPISMSVS